MEVYGKTFTGLGPKGMVLNSVKTKVMLVTANQKRLRLQNTNLKLQYTDETLKIISNDKTLGVYVDNNLSWSDHHWVVFFIFIQILKETSAFKYMY